MHIVGKVCFADTVYKSTGVW